MKKSIDHYFWSLNVSTLKDTLWSISFNDEKQTIVYHEHFHQAKESIEFTISNEKLKTIDQLINQNIKINSSFEPPPILDGPNYYFISEKPLKMISWKCPEQMNKNLSLLFNEVTSCIPKGLCRFF